jgi:amino acid transporter
LFAFSSIIFLLPYLALFPAILKLRYSDADAKRPYKVPGGNIVVWIMSIVSLILILQAIVFFIWVPGGPVDWAYATPVLIGVVVTIVIGEIILWWTKR